MQNMYLWCECSDFLCCRCEKCFPWHSACIRYVYWYGLFCSSSLTILDLNMFIISIHEKRIFECVLYNFLNSACWPRLINIQTLISLFQIDNTMRNYTKKNNWRILKFVWFYYIWEKSFPTKVFLYLIGLSICNSAICKIKF